MADEPTPLSRVTVEDHFETVTVRRAPRHGVFLILGAVVGVIVAAILTFAFQGTQQPSAAGVQYSTMQVFGFLALACAAIGLLLGGVVALILDRTMGRRSRRLRVDREHVRVDEP
jgi:uncharacterized membrane protein